MLRTRSATVAALLLLTLPAVLVATPAALAEDAVPFAPSVPYRVEPAFTHRLYLNFGNAGGSGGDTATPDCAVTRLAFSPREDPSPQTSRAHCVVAAGAGGAGSGTPVGDSLGGLRPFVTDPLARGFNVTGNQTLHYVHEGRLSAGMTLIADVYSGTRLVGSGRVVVTGDNANSGTFVLPIEFDQLASRASFDRGAELRLVLRGVTQGDASPLAAPTTFTVSDTGSYLEIVSQDAVRTAAWVGEVGNGQPRALFRPLTNATPANEAPRMQFHFSVQSAFGGDAANGPAPTFSLTRNGEPAYLDAAGSTRRTGFLNVTYVETSAGIATWTLGPGQAIDYRGFPSGEYTLHVSARHQQGAGYTSGVSARFAISSQGVTLRPYEDAGISAESAGHDVAPGGSTTYLLLLNNTGGANDTFRVTATFVTGTPATGWSAVVGGPAVSGRGVTVAPGKTALVTVTVTAPFGAPAGSGGIFRVNATSVLDATATSQAITLATTVSNVVRREVAVLAPEAQLDIDPGQDVDMPVYVWNRGTRAANISLELQESAVQGWTVDLLNGNTPVQRVILSNVPAGGIAEATLRANGPLNQVVRTYPVTLNATSLDASAVAHERVLRFSLRTVGGVSVQVIENIAGLGRVAEIMGPASPADTLPAGRCSTSSVPCRPDNVSGVWFRVWVTNTGRVTDTFTLGLDSIDYARVPQDCTTDVFGGGDYAPNTDFFRFYSRSPSGRFSGIEGNRIVDLPAGRTAEVYVWRSAQGDQDLCPDRDTGTDFFSFVVSARGVATGSLGTASAIVTAENTGGGQAVLVEPVARTPVNERAPDQGPFLVDVANATKRSITGSAFVGENATYRVRVTNAATWGAYFDGAKRVEPRVNVYTEGALAKQAGWNISIRPILDAVDNPVRAGVANYSFTNEVNGRVEGWRDLEFEVNVTAPNAANGTALAGTSGHFTVRAEMPGFPVSSSVEITTFVARAAEIALASDTPSVPAHAGEAAPALVVVRNVGSAEANVTLRAVIDPATPNANLWRVDPAFQNFRVSAFRDRSVALQVTPPPGVGAGTQAFVNVVAEYTPSSRGNTTLRLPVLVSAPGTLDVSSPTTDATIAPGGYANFTVNLRNRGNIQMSYLLTSSPLPDWETTVSQSSGVLAAGETRSISYVLRAPTTVEDNTRFATVVRAVEEGNDANFDAQTLAVNILGGKAVPALSLPLLQKRVDRGGVQFFPVEVRNTGNAVGRMPLEVRSADPAWQVALQDERGENVTSIRLAPNELVVLNVSVRAPLVVPERTVVPVEVSANAEDFSQAAKVTLRAEIHDYGVQMTLAPSRVESAPGVPSEFVIRVRNTGNDNDTLNVSAHMVDLPEWTVALSANEVALEPGREGEVRAVVRSPVQPLPTPRTYAFKFFSGTVGGAAVNLWKNDSANAAVVIQPYRAFDVDRDDRTEVFIDADGRAANGFEQFRDPFTDGVNTVSVATSYLDGKARHFLDRAPLDGIADAWFDPESVFLFEIEHSPDIDGDGTPNYLVDTDRDGKIDRAYDSDTDTYWVVKEIKAHGDERIQYVVDTSLDGRPDWYYDPEQDRPTRTTSVSGAGANVVGIDTDDDGKVDKHYDYRANTLRDATTAKATGFFADYWYFFALFGLVLLTTVLLFVARRRRAEE